MLTLVISKSLPYPSPENRPISGAPTTSSVYSEPTSEYGTPQMQRLEIPRSSSVYPDDVSPPESIRTIDGARSRESRGSPDVSPITDPMSTPAESNPGQGKFNSHIPVSRKPPMFGGSGSLFSRKTRPSALASGLRDSSSTGLTRWDDFSGERTAGEKGKPASTSPDAVRRDVELKYGRRTDSLGNSVEISGPTRRVSNRSPWVPVGWKGAGGRHAMVNPMLDKPLPPGKSPTFPTGSHQRTTSNDPDMEEGRYRSMSSANASPSPEGRIPPAIAEPIQHHHTTESQRRTEKSLPEITTSRASQQPTPPADSPRSGLSPDDTRSPLARNPSNEDIQIEHSSNFPGNTPTNGAAVAAASDTNENYTVPALNWRKAAAPERPPVTDLQNYHVLNQPQSRFSATTYATTAYDSPPTTPETNHDVPMPSPPSSILDRRRPVPTAGVLSSKVAARKPTPSQISAIEKSDPESNKNNRHSKTLPKEPPEEKAISRVESLQAKLDALRRRRGNLQTVIHELTNVVQPSSIAYDVASRQEIKKTVEGLNKELSEVVQQEHDTGLTLHRAWKRHDNATAYEPTHLWVRRVTT